MNLDEVLNYRRSVRVYDKKLMRQMLEQSRV